jgi:hypothetical protein
MFYSQASGDYLHMHGVQKSQGGSQAGSQGAPASRRWSRSRARCICPRRHLRVLPIRTRPSLFGGD